MARPGQYPDALVPAVDEYVNETRNALPVSVPAGQTRVLWIDIFVPPGTPPGLDVKVILTPPCIVISLAILCTKKYRVV
jgi:hypothetical protein